MSEFARSRPSPRELDIGGVLDAAFRLASDIGIGSLSLPLLADYLEIDEGSLGSLVSDRNELIHWMEARAVVELDWQLPTPEARDPAQWRAFLREYFGRQRSVLAGDELLTSLTVMRSTNHAPEVLNFGYPKLEAILDYLSRAGFPLRDAWDLFSASSIYTQGFTTVERRSQANGLPAAPSLPRAEFGVDQLPRIVRLLGEEGVSIGRPGEATFDAGLQWIFDGAARTAGLNKTTGPG